MKKLNIAISDADKSRYRAVFRQKGNRVSGETYLRRMINLHRADEAAARLTGDPDTLESNEASLVLKAAERMLARNPKTDYGGIIEEMDHLRRTDPPAGIPKKEHWVRALLRFGAA